MARVDLKDTIDFNYETYIWNSAAGKIPIFVFNSTVTYSQSDYYYYSGSFTAVPIYWPTICFFGSINTGTSLNPNYNGNVATGSGDGITSTITNTTDTSLTFNIIVGNDDVTYETVTGGWGTNTERAQTLGFAVIKMADGTCVRASSAILTTKDIYGNDLVPLTIPSVGSTGTTTETPLSSLTAFSLTGSASYTKVYAEFITPIVTGAELYDPDNPYAGGDESTDPGDGQFDYEGDEIGIPDLPNVSVTDSGFVRLFNPSISQLQSLVSFMWSDEFSLDTFKKMLNNPMDCILGLSIIPVNVPVGSAREITVGNIVSTVSANVVTSQFISVDCGSLEISPTLFTGSYLDYSPYVKAYIYLPFIGVQEVNIDDVMNSTLHVVYHVDLLTGACVCYVQATNRTTGGVSQPDAVLYTYMGQCAESVPLSSSDFTGAMGSILNAAASIGGVVAGVATGGMSALTGAALSGVASSVASATTTQKPSISHSGSMGGSSGFMNIRYPYMIFDCPHTSIPQKQRLYTGYPSNKIIEIGNLSGFNVIQAINLTIQYANDSELEEIQNILERGVII